MVFSFHWIVLYWKLFECWSRTWRFWVPVPQPWLQLLWQHAKHSIKVWMAFSNVLNNAQVATLRLRA